MFFESHFFDQVPCEPICESNEPTESPTTQAPTAYLETKLSVDCLDDVDVLVIDKTPENATASSDIINILELNSGSVKLEVLIQDDFEMISVGYDDARNNHKQCYQDYDVLGGERVLINAACYDDFASLTVILYTGDDFDIETCGACSLPSDETEGFVAITFEIDCSPISCEPSIAPSPSSSPSLHSFSLANLSLAPEKSLSQLPSLPDEPDCYDGITTTQKNTGGDPMCEYSSQPFTIEELDNSGSNELRFSFQNNWPAAIADIELFYDMGDGFGPQCLSLNSLAYGAIYPNTLAAACDPVTRTAEIEVFVSNTSISNSSARSQCGNSGAGLCSYVYKIPCSADILCDPSRRLDTHDINSKAGTEQGFIHTEMRVPAIESRKSEFDENKPYCLHQHFPCDGDEESMVHVCYYSSESGYQTLCIPEIDSDILRFNKNHHCGSCEFWN